MRTCLCKWVVTAFAAAVAVASALAQSPDEIKVDIELKEADMLTATQVLTRETGLMFVIEPTSDPFPKITLSLKRVSAEDAIRYICRAAGAIFRRDENGVYVIGRGGSTEPARPAGDPPVPTAPKPKVSKKFKLMKADAKEMYNKLRFGLNPDPMQTFRELTTFVQQNQMNFTRSYLSPPVVAGATSSGNYQPVPTSALPNRSLEKGSDILLPGESAPQDLGGRGGGAGGGGFQGGGGGLGQGGGGFGQGGGIGGGQGNLQAGQGLVGQSIDFISYDPVDNSIVVRGSEEDIADLQRWISMFDVAPQQVIIKVEFITTSSSTATSLGFDWLYERGTMFAGNRPGSFARAGDPIFINYATGNITTRMRTLLQQGYGKVVQAPVVRTLNNQFAAVQQNVLTTVFVSQIVSVGNGQIINAPQPFQITITTGLVVAPRINGDGTVTVSLNVPVQDFGQLRRSPDGTEFPDVLSQIISVVARVKSGETIALGGLVRKQDTGSLAKFPVLADLPIIGQFFQARTRDRNNTELLIFVTPTIVADESSGGLGP